MCFKYLIYIFYLTLQIMDFSNTEQCLSLMNHWIEKCISFAWLCYFFKCYKYSSWFLGLYHQWSHANTFSDSIQLSLLTTMALACFRGLEAHLYFHWLKEHNHKKLLLKQNVKCHTHTQNNTTQTQYKRKTAYSKHVYMDRKEIGRASCRERVSSPV